MDKKEIEAFLAKEERKFGKKYALIIDECPESTRDDLMSMGGGVFDIFPLFDLVAVSVSIVGQLECRQDKYGRYIPMGFQRYTLNVGYRCNRDISQFNSKLLLKLTR